MRGRLQQSCKNARTLSVLFSGLLYYFLPVYSVHASTVFFVFCCKNWWMNGHPLSLKGGATCFLWYFTLSWGKLWSIAFVLFLCVNFLSVLFFTLFTTMALNAICISLYFVPGLLKRQKLKFGIYFPSQTSITGFGFAPWSHSIW